MRNPDDNINKNDNYASIMDSEKIAEIREINRRLICSDNERSEILRRVKQQNEINRELEKLGNDIIFSAVRLAETLLRSASLTEKHLSDVEKFTKELRELLKSAPKCDRLLM
ncbi:hypothetical protein [Methylotenera sp.]|uniref:hypothetical protein n=1 Tax=Methylotenera sp. TaxID=2051956 RepID=UPI0027332244|nr:hypothetical protein [Methylotenera sp.]MDP3778390.1 hypothetical protein [Methylotenera sp.]